MRVNGSHSARETALAAIDDSVEDTKLLSDGITKSNKCGECGKEFRRVYDLNRHQKLHSGAKPHQCNRCNKRFSRADALIRHMRPMGSCAQRFSMQTAQAASGGDPATAAVSAVLDSKHNFNNNLSLSPTNVRNHFVPLVNQVPSNMRPEEISALINRCQSLEQRVNMLEQRMNRAEHRINRLEIAKSEHERAKEENV